jgi:competence protein ComEC
MSLGAPRLDWADPLGLVRGRPGRWVVVPIQAGIGAQLGCLPILATQFHWLSPWGVVTGPIVIPLASVFVSAVLMALSLAGLWAPLGHLLLGGSALLGEGLLALSRLGAQHLSAPWPLATPGLPALGLFAGSGTLAGVLGAASRSKRRSVAFSIALLGTGLSTVGIVLGLPSARGRPAAVEVIFLDVGQGDSALLLVHGPRQWIDCLGIPRAPQRALICDCGDHPPGGFDCGAGIVAPALAALGVRAVDHALLSHGDRDHLGGLAGLATWLPVREVLWPAALPVPGALASLKLPLRGMSAGDTLGLGPGITLAVLHPARDFAGGSNDGSLTVSLRAFGERVLFLGDLEAVGETALLSGARAKSLPAQVVKVAHHGSATSSTDPLVQAVSPETAVVSVGARNRFGHPNPAVLARWQARGARIVRTDQMGAVTLWLSPAGRELRTAISRLGSD